MVEQLQSKYNSIAGFMLEPQSPQKSWVESGDISTL